VVDSAVIYFRCLKVRHEPVFMRILSKESIRGLYQLRRPKSRFAFAEPNLRVQYVLADNAVPDSERPILSIQAVLASSLHVLRRQDSVPGKPSQNEPAACLTHFVP